MAEKINDGETAITRYLKKMKKIQLHLNPDKEQDLIDFLETKKNKTEYIKKLIRNDMQQNKRS